MLILLENPLHGRMHVHSPSEVERHKPLGWTVVDESEDLKKEEVQVRRKPGPKPREK